SDPEIRDRTVRAYTAIGLLYALQHEPHKARDAFIKSLALSEEMTRDFPAEARAWLRLAQTRMVQVERLTGQDAEFDAAEEYHKAMDAFETAARCAPDDPRALENLAWHLTISDETTSRDPARAVALARRAVELVSDNGIIWNTLGLASYRAGSWGEAVRALEMGLALPPKRTTHGNDKAMTWFYLAMAYSRLGQ